MKKVALVTGGSGLIGSAICLKLAQDGFFIALHYSSNEEIAQSVKFDIESIGGKCSLFKCDFSSPESVGDMFKDILTSFKRVDVLVNNAGVDGGRYDLFNTSLETQRKVMSINYFSPVECIKFASEIMRKKSISGAIVNITSQVATFGGYHLSHYAASKAALVGHSIGAAKQLMKDNIRLNNVSPGVIESNKLTADKVQSLLNEIPANRLATTEDIANVVSWLVSEKAAYVSGTTIPVTAAR